jgi:CspA family cold shock protein
MSNNGLSSTAQPANGEGASGPRKRKIDRSEWPTLLARRQAGATQAQIAQDYGVSQGTVSQILKRAKAEAEGQPVADLDAEPVAGADGQSESSAPAQAAAPTSSSSAAASSPAASPAPASTDGARATGSTQVSAPANDAATPRRTLTTRSRSSTDSTSESGGSPAPGAVPTGSQAAPAPTPETGADGPQTASTPARQNADGDPGHRSGNALADRLREATERCAQLVDQKATSDTLSSAVHEVRRALAAIEIDAAKQNSPAAQRPRQAPASRPSQSASATAQQPPRAPAPEPFEPPRREPGVDSSKAAGRVKFFKPEKGFGFIIPDDGGDDIFVGKDTVQAAGIDRLSEGDRVRYTPGPGAKGLEAKTIERIG